MDYINKIRTVDGDKPVNYEALANKPGAFTGASDTEAGAAFSVTISTQMPEGVEVAT